MTPRSRQTANKEKESRRLSPAAAAKQCAYQQETPATEASGEELCPDPGATCLFLSKRPANHVEGLARAKAISPRIAEDQQADAVLVFFGVAHPAAAWRAGGAPPPLFQPPLRQPLHYLLCRWLLPQGEQPSQCLAQVGERVYPQVLARRHHAVQHRRRLAARLAPQDAPVVPTQGDGAQRPLAEVVVYRQIPLLQVASQRLPVVQGVADRLAQSRLRQRLGPLLLQPLLQLGQDRSRLLLPPLASLLFPLPAQLDREGVVRGQQQRGQLALDGVQLPDQLHTRVAAFVPAVGRRHELAAGVRPAADVQDPLGAIQPLVLGQGVGL